jgi:fumarate hydratase subunit alpha
MLKPQACGWSRARINLRGVLLLVAIGVAGLRDRVREFLVELIRVATTQLPDDVVRGLKRAYEVEDNPVARKQLEAILRNVELASRLWYPICQDTGTPYFYVKLGADFPLRAELDDVIREAVREATRKVPLRPNAVDPIRERNSGDNTGLYIPWIELELVPGDTMEVTYVAKGGGSEAPSTLVMAPPIQGAWKLRETVLKAVVDAGPKPCPPVIIGVGIGPGAAVALSLAKKAAVLRPVGSRHPDPEVAKLEEELLEAVNRLGIGAHGFGGRVTALDLHIEYAFRHPATYAIGVVVSCWATRRASGVIDSHGEWRITSHSRLPPRPRSTGG